MTVSENKTTHEEICCNKQNLAVGQGVRCIVVHGHDTFTGTITGQSLVLLLYNDATPSLKYTLADTSFEVAANMAKVIWIDDESRLSIMDVAPAVNAIILIVPYSEISRNEFDLTVTTYELGYRSKLLLNQITDKRDEKSINSFLVKSQLYELLYLQLEEIQITQGIKLQSYYEKAILAKSIIDEDITKNYTIPELAKLVGTNEQYLKTYFKQYYNKTISQYSTETKMECAKKLIMSGEYRIADVARMTGYKHATHFTTAFKKYFGFKPNLLK